MTWILIILVGSNYIKGVGVTVAPAPYLDLVTCQSAGEQWKRDAKETQYSPMYYCIPGPPRT